MTAFDRRAFLATSGATALAVGFEPSAWAAAPKQGDAALKATLDAVFQDDIRFRPETATSLGLDKGALAALKTRLDPATAAERRRIWMPSRKRSERASVAIFQAQISASAHARNTRKPPNWNHGVGTPRRSARANHPRLNTTLAALATATWSYARSAKDRQR